MPMKIPVERGAGGFRAKSKRAGAGLPSEALLACDSSTWLNRESRPLAQDVVSQVVPPTKQAPGPAEGMDNTLGPSTFQLQKITAELKDGGLVEPETMQEVKKLKKSNLSSIKYKNVDILKH